LSPTKVARASTPRSSDRNLGKKDRDTCATVSHMDLSSYRHTDSILIGRSASELYDMVSDITRMGEFSPVCTSCSWDDVSQAGREGAWFRGTNAIGDFTWDTRCKVVAADPGQNFSFVNCGLDGKAELVRWGFSFEEQGDETTVTETWQVLPDYPKFITADDPEADVAARIDGMAALARDGIRDTLGNLKRVAEA
jgi:Polyketide cyclase / dehydrase and lipid transport